MPLLSLTQVFWVYIFVQRYCTKMEQQKQLTCFLSYPKNLCILFFCNNGLFCRFISVHVDVNQWCSLPLSVPIPKALPKSVSPDDKQLWKQLKGTKRPGRLLSPRRPCLLDKGPFLLTSINPPQLCCRRFRVLLGKICPKTERGFWVMGMFLKSYLLWTVSIKINKKVARSRHV